MYLFLFAPTTETEEEVGVFLDECFDTLLSHGVHRHLIGADVLGCQPLAFEKIGDGARSATEDHGNIGARHVRLSIASILGRFFQVFHSSHSTNSRMIGQIDQLTSIDFVGIPIVNQCPMHRKF